MTLAPFLGPFLLWLLLALGGRSFVRILWRLDCKTRPLFLLPGNVRCRTDSVRFCMDHSNRAFEYIILRFAP